MRGRAVAAGVVVIVLVVIAFVQPTPGTVLASSPLLGRPAPPLTGPILAGPPLVQSSLRGRFVVVNFFASWCVDCRIEAPQLSLFHAQHKSGRTVRMVMVAFADKPNTARAFLASTGATWTSLEDPQGQNTLYWGVRAPPETFVVAPNGIVVAKFVGPVTADALDAVLAGGPRRSAQGAG